MPYIELEGKDIGEVWRGQESDKELICFSIKNHWLRVEYTGELMLERANYMAEKLKAAANLGNRLEVGVEYDAPSFECGTYSVSYIQVRA